MILVYSLFFLYLILVITIIFFTRNSIQLRVNNKSSEYLVKVSVIVSVRNEEDNILNLIESFKNQSYPSDYTEFIIIDDHSEDSTFDLLNKNLDLIKNYQLPPNVFGKKSAIEYGVNQSTGELILVTDADCILQKDHIVSFVNIYNMYGAKFISGPVVLHTQQSQKSLLYQFQIVEFGSLIMIGEALINMKTPLLCNAANMGFPKQAFLEINGYSKNTNIPSGDDEFLLKEISNRYPNKIYFNGQSVVSTHALKQWSDFIQQRVRWASKHKTYSLGFTCLLLLIFAVNIAPFILLIMNRTSDMVFIVCLKLLIDSIMLSKLFKYYNMLNIFLYLPLIVIIYPFYLIYIGIRSNFGSYQWKGRNVNLGLSQ